MAVSSDNTKPAGLGAGSRILLTLAAIVIVVAGLKSASSIVNYFLISLILALVSASPVFWLQRKGLPIGLGIILVTVIIVTGIVAMAGILGNSIVRFNASLPEYQVRLKENIAPIENWLEKKGIEIAEPSLFPQLDPENILGLVVNLLGNISGILSNLLLILLTVTFMLLDTAGFQNRLRQLSPRSSSSSERFREITRQIRQYLVLKTWISLATGLAVGIWVALMGLDFPVIWGLLAFFFNFIPNIGSILAAVPAVLLALIQFGAWQAGVIALGYIAINIVIGNYLEPRIMGRGIGMPTSLIFLALIFWGWVLGPVGMILSVPLTVMIKIGLDSSDDTRWLAMLISAGDSKELS